MPGQLVRHQVCQRCVPDLVSCCGGCCLFHAHPHVTMARMCRLLPFERVCTRAGLQATSSSSCCRYAEVHVSWSTDPHCRVLTGGARCVDMAGQQPRRAPAGEHREPHTTHRHVVGRVQPHWCVESSRHDAGMQWSDSPTTPRFCPCRRRVPAGGPLPARMFEAPFPRRTRHGPGKQSGRP